MSAHRRYRVVLDLEADEKKDLVDTIKEVAALVEKGVHGMQTAEPGKHFALTVTEDAEMTHDRYLKERAAETVPTKK